MTVYWLVGAAVAAIALAIAPRVKREWTEFWIFFDHVQAHGEE